MLKKSLTILLAIAMCFSLFALRVLAEGEVNTYSYSYVVMESNSGKVLASRYADEPVYPASITKIMTTGLFLEKFGSNLNREYVVAWNPVMQENLSGTTHIALKPDEVVSYKSLVYTTMIESANDSANCLADAYMDGDFYNFYKVMNEKATELGCKNTNFLNANGLPETYHYTTAYDMALITKWALQQNGFRAVWGAKNYSMPADNVKPTNYNVRTHNNMILENDDYYDSRITGGKLGWTEEAMHTMVATAEKDGLEIIIVVMFSEHWYEKFIDISALCNYAFNNFNSSMFPKREEVVKPLLPEEPQMPNTSEITEITEITEKPEIDEILLPDIPEIHIKERNMVIYKIKNAIIWGIAICVIIYMIIWVIKQKKRRLARERQIARRMASLKSNTDFLNRR